MRVWMAAVFACLAAAAGQEQPQQAISVDLFTTDVTVAADGSFVETTHIEARALNDAAAMSIGRIDVPFMTEMQTLDIVEAYTKKADGTKIPVDISTITEQMAQDQSHMLTDWRVKAILFPHFAGGDTAVYTVRVATTKPYFPGAFFYGGAFPPSSPLKDVRRTVTAPKSMGLRSEVHGVKLETSEQGDTVVYSLHYASPGAAEQDPPAVSPLDSVPRFFLSSFKDYDALGRAYATAAAPKAAVTEKVRTLAASIVKSATDRREQVRLIYDWVTTRIRYVAVELGQGSMVPHDADTVLTNGYGDCKDHDTLLQALLKARGFEPVSALLNLGNGYSLTEVPTFSTLNHVITYLPEFKLFLDSSNAFAPFGMLSFEAYGKPVVFATPERGWVGRTPLVKSGLAMQKTVTVSKLAADGTLSGTTVTSAEGPTAISLRGIGMMVQAGGEKAVKMLLSMRGMGEGVGSFETGSPFERTPGYSVTGKFSTPGWEKPATGKETFVMPGGLRVLGLSGDGLLGSVESDKKKEGEPIPCFSGRDEEDLSLAPPDGMRFVAVPPDANISGPNFTFTAHWSLAGNTLSVHRSFESRIDAPFCTGAVHKANAAALRRVAENYNDTKLRLVPSAMQPMPDAKIVSITARDAGAKDLAAKGIVGPPLGTAVQYMKDGRYDEAVAEYSRMLSLVPDDATALTGLCRAAARASAPGDAVAVCTALLNVHPLSGQLLLSRGIAYYRLGKYAEALRDFETAARTYPGNAEYVFARGAAKIKLGDGSGQADIVDAMRRDTGIGETMKRQKLEL